ncbi:hypothetical protein [Clostridium weizhouense]|uniref:Transposase n=1 Tax=Clostridium weizhouense TaxID=2859781 RepID=A0ABS7AT21_9CLOT|nr:hypothetical protein [Clostridium weizhouense]MBW6411566.1 hypothetical protein [Clostridium weizhouense]
MFEKDEIVGEDFHKMLLAIQNLIEYLNRNYFNDKRLEEEVTMTKTLYDPIVEKKRIEKKAKETAIKAIKMGMTNEVINELTGLSDKEINDIRKEQSH